MIFFKFEFFLAFVLVSVGVKAQKADFRFQKPESLPFGSFTMEHGLSNSHVNAICQDSKGYIWIGTNDGLNRYDGQNIERFYHFSDDSKTINNSTVCAIYSDRSGRIWFGTFSGLCYYDYETESFVTKELPPQSNTVNSFPVKSILETDDGNIWIGLSGGGLAVINPKTDAVKYYRHNDSNPNSLCSDGIITMSLDKNGCIWIGSEDNGISIFDTKELTFTNINKSSGKIPGNIVNKILCTSDNKVIIGSYDSGLTIYDPETKTFKVYDECKNVFSIAESARHNLWIGTESSGLYYYDFSEDKFYRYCKANGTGVGLIGDNIHVVFPDKDNNLWLGVFQGGINLLKPKPLFSGAGYAEGKPKSGISQKPVLSLCPGGDNIILIGTDGGGLDIWNLLTNEFKNFKAGSNGLKTNVIRCIYRDHDNRVWLGTYLEGLQEFHRDKNIFTGYVHKENDIESLSHNDVTSIIEDRLGNFWVGTNGGGLNLLDKEKGTFKVFKKDLRNPDKSLVDNHITSMYIDCHGYLWIGTYWGLSRMDPVKYEFKNFISCGGNDSYNCMLEDSHQNFWAGTSDGLKLLNTSDGSCKVFSVKDGLPNNVINAIEEDYFGNLWISTGKGICKFNYQEMSFENFSTDDGLFSDEFLHNSFCKTLDGRIFFGSTEGVTEFDPKDIKTVYEVPKVLIKDLLVFNKIVKPGDETGILEKSVTECDNLVLKSGFSSFTIKFGAVEYIRPERIVYACRMTGFNDDWEYHDYRQNSSTYTNLDAGVYSFQVKASADSKNWSKPVTLRITILAPFWKRPWMKFLYFLSILTLVVFIWNRYRRYEHEKNEIKLNLLKQQNDIELNKARLQLFTNVSHEFRTPLTLIISPLENMIEDKRYDEETHKNLNLMHRNALRLMQMVNKIMDLRKIDNGKMDFNPQKGDLVAFVKEVYENFCQLAQKKDTEFTFNSSLKDFYAYFDRDQIDKVMYNLLSNSFKFTPNGGKISITLKKSDDNILIIVEDNGCGIAPENTNKIFDRFFQAGSSQMQQGTGIGLWLAKRFVEMHHGIISVSSRQGEGTAFTVMLSDGAEFASEALSKENYGHIKPESFYDNAQQESFSKEGGVKSTLLIVEDNPEIRDYLASELSKLYDVKTAENGKTGLNLTKEILPDLIITDIMMPEMDGIEFTRIVKNDVETCHIPVIMLTAKGTEEQRIEGLETGADSYIPKPFNPKHLLVRIQKLLELRKALKEKFSKDAGFNAEQTAVSVPDRDLLRKVTTVIKKRISDSQLSVETLSEEVGLSRGHLQRKLKSLTGQNPNEFIRIIRLKQAAEILSQKDVTIAEVADMVGFGSQSYFSTAFTKQFNISPSQYVENLKKSVGKNSEKKI